MMEEHDSEPETSSFPLFNLDALKHAFPQVPMFNLFNLGAPQPHESFLEKTAKVSKPPPVKKKRGRKSIGKKKMSKDDFQTTLKDILENDQVGVPMAEDVNFPLCI